MVIINLHSAYQSKEQSSLPATKSLPKKRENTLVLPLRHLLTGLSQVKYVLLYHHAGSECIINKTFLALCLYLLHLEKNQKSLSIVESLQGIKWTTFRDKSLLCNQNTLSTIWLRTSVAVLIGNVGGYKPFWNKRCLDMSKKLWLPIEHPNRVHRASDLTSSSSSWTTIKSNSLFSIRVMKRTNSTNSKMTYCQSLPSSHVEEMGKDVTRARKIRLYPNPRQKKLITQWMGTCRYVYNRALSGIKEKTDTVNFQRLRNKYVTKKNNDICNDWEYSTPKDVRAGEMKSLESSYKTCFKLYQTGKIKTFSLGFKSKRSNQTITIPKIAVKQNSSWKRKLCIFPRKGMGFIKTSRDKIPVINSDMKLTKQNGNYYLIIPYKTKEYRRHNNNNREIALDPGIRKFFTGYSETEVCKMETNKILMVRLRYKLDKLQSLRSRGFLKTKRWRRSRQRVQNRIDNLRDDYHYQMIDYLTKNYSTIHIPKFKSQEWTGVGRNRDLLQLSHYKFKQRLSDVVELINGCQYKETTEEYTSKTCTRCGMCNNVGSSETYKCIKCGLVLDRDLNGSRNIYIKVKRD